VEVESEALDLPDPNDMTKPLHEFAGPGPLLGDLSPNRVLPTCAAEPELVGSGQSFSLHVEQYPGATDLDLSVDGELVGSGHIDSTGAGTLPMIIQQGTGAGTHLLGARQRGTAIQSLCPVTVTGSSPVASCCDRVAETDENACSATSVSVDCGSFDPDGGSVIITQNPPGPYPPGDTEVVMTVTDDEGQTAECTGHVTVRDASPPTASVELTPATLWPPDHRLVRVSASVNAHDNCGGSQVVLASITSSEPDDAPGNGDGNTIKDIQDVGVGTTDLHFLLRAEREGSGPGRRYVITYIVRDASGNERSAIGVVQVPHNGPAR
jgi:hypothetical protein